MNTNQLHGFSLIEVMLAVALFALIASAFAGSYFYGQEATVLAGNRQRATLYAQEGLEAVRNIRDADYNNLTNGTYGLDSSGGSWSLSGSADTRGIFTREITITNAGSNRKKVTAKVTWQQNKQRDGTVELVTRLTHWQETKKQGNKGQGGGSGGGNQGGGNQGQGNGGGNQGRGNSGNNAGGNN